MSKGNRRRREAAIKAAERDRRAGLDTAATLCSTCKAATAPAITAVFNSQCPACKAPLTQKGEAFLEAHPER